VLDAAADEDGGVDDAAADEDGGPDDAAADEDAAEGATAAGVLDPGVPAVVAEALEDAAGGDTNPDAPPEPLAPTVDIHHDDPEFGYRLITDELRNLGHAASENRVGRLCTQQQIYWAFAKKKGLRNRPGPAVHDDRVKRKFTAEAANTLWLTDITEHRTDEGKLYLCAIKDLWSNRIVGYSIDSNMKATLAVRALHSAIGARPHEGCILHSDRGSQIRSKKFVRTLTNNGLLGSMGRVGACADWGAPLEPGEGQVAAGGDRKYRTDAIHRWPGRRG